MHTLGRLLRLSLLPSAVADVTVGMLLGGAGVWPEGVAPGLLVLSSLGIYHGSMALNDWADRHEDARLRPGRPLPSGALGAPLALWLGLGLLALGVAAAFRIDASDAPARAVLRDHQARVDAAIGALPAWLGLLTLTLALTLT